MQAGTGAASTLPQIPRSRSSTTTCGCASPAASGASAAARREVEGKFLLGHIPQAQREPLLIHYRAALRGEQRSFEYHSRDRRDYWVRIVRCRRKGR